MRNLTSNNLFFDNSDLHDNEILRRAISAGHIDSLDKLRQYPDLDASLIRYILGPISKNTKKVEYKPKDPSICVANDCSVYKLANSMTDLPDILNDAPDNPLFNSFAEASLFDECKHSCSSCPYNNSVCITHYNNPKKQYHLYNTQRDRFAGKDKIHFKKIQIKLLIVLQGWPNMTPEDDSNDVILKDVYVPDLARIINCNSEYLEDCLNELGILDIIDLTRKGPHLYDVIIPNHYLKYKKANKSGSGYIQISHQILKELIAETNIIRLRGMLIQLLKNPVKNTDRIQKVDTISFDEIKSFMPEYVNYKALYQKAMQNSLFVIDISTRDRKLYFKAKSHLEGIENKKIDIMNKNFNPLAKYIDVLSPTFVNDKNAKEQSSTFLSGVNKIYDQLKNTLPTKIKEYKPYISILKDSLLISVEYGLENVLVSLRQLEREYRLSGIDIKNAGAMLRSICCYNKFHGFGYTF